MSPANVVLVLLLSLMASYCRDLHANVVELRTQCDLTRSNLASYEESTRTHLETMTESVHYVQEKYTEMELRIAAAENTATAAHETRSSKSDCPTPSESELPASVEDV